jgi:hypothetical protein
VQSEDEPERMLLETRISRDDGYQKQQGIYMFGAITLTELDADDCFHRYSYRMD